MALTTHPTPPTLPQPSQATPKRKRGEDDSSIAPIHTTAHFSFRLPPPGSDDSGCESPRTKFARQFKLLNIEEQSGGGVNPQQQLQQMHHQDEHVASRALLAGDSKPKPDYDEDDDGVLMRKRQKVPDIEMRDSASDISELPASPTPQQTSSNVHPEPQLELEAITIKDTSNPDSDPSSTADHLHRSYPSINRLQDSQSRQPKRVGTPPAKKKKEHIKKKLEISDSEDDAPKIVEPVRAALTWHEDEITIYDPEDSDDDGVGVNGIGFKPTAAQTRARIAKRKQQLAEYRKREEKEARAKRSQRRRGSAAGLPAAVTKNKTATTTTVARRVRFMETEAGAAVLTESV